MTTETAFAQHHTSTWRLLAPAMDLFVRKINLRLYAREFPVLKSETASNRRGFINEIAFNLFAECPEESSELTDEIFLSAVDDARERISRLEEVPISALARPSSIEKVDCKKLLARLRIFFQKVSKQKRLEIRPQFPGAGIIGSCEGDVFFNSTLFEVKAGQRPYRAVDLKQLLTYAVLNHASRARPLSELGLFNPRMGTSFRAPLDDICHEISGCTSAELLPEITRVISSGDLSR